MAGVKGRSGGARPNAGGARAGAGRKPKPKPAVIPVPPIEGPDKSPTDRDMLQLLTDVALGRVDATALQVRAAIAAVQYTHTKRGDGGKKEETDAKAKKAASKFKPAAAPLKLVN